MAHTHHISLWHAFVTLHRYGDIPKSSLLNIPLEMERGRRHVASEFDPEFEKGTSSMFF